MPLAFLSLLPAATPTEVRRRFAAFADAAEAAFDMANLAVGTLIEQFVTATVNTVAGYVSLDAQAIRGMFVDYTTDPGDVDAYNAANEGLAPDAGWASRLGENNYGTTRGGATFATGVQKFTNASGATQYFFPGGDTVQNSNTAKTYKTDVDATIYVNADGSVTLADGASIDLPIIADEIGTGSNAAASEITILATSRIGVTTTNAGSVIGTDREGIAAYRARMRKAPSRVSLGGPSDLYQYLANTTIDGQQLYRADGVTPVGITRVYVSEDSATGIVNAYFADDDGAAVAGDVTAANLNITTYAMAVPGAITYTGVAAIEVTINVSYTAKIKSAQWAGVDSVIAGAAIQAALDAYFSGIDIGGFDRVLGAGVVYTEDIEATINGAHVAIYKVSVTTPAGASTALALGRVAKLGTVTGTVTIT